jgi:hypothetical protein
MTHHNLAGVSLLTVGDFSPFPLSVVFLRGLLTIPPRYLPTYLAMQPMNIGYLLRPVVSHHRLLSRPSSPHLVKEYHQARWTLLRRCAQSARSPIQPLTTTDDTDVKAAS